MIAEKIDKKDFILDVAEKLFAQMGFEGVSTRALAAKASVNMAMLNYYFGSKDGLYQAVINRRLKDFYETLTNLNEENISSWDKLNRFIELYVDRVLSPSFFHKLIQRELSLEHRSQTTALIVESILKNANEVKRILLEGINNGSFRKVDVELTVATIFGTNYYLTHIAVIASQLLEKDLSNNEVLKTEVKPRVKAHLTDLLKTHLTKHETEVN